MAVRPDDELLRAARVPALSDPDERRQREAFVTSATQATRRPRWLLAPAAAMAGLLALGLWLQGAPAETVMSTTDAPKAVTLADGSTVTVQPASLARFVQHDSDRATVTLERGRVALKVTHAERTAWKVQAGDFSVAVVGTVFETRWDPGEQRLEVEVTEGEVRLSGPGLGAGVQVSAGHQFVRSRATFEVKHVTPTVEPAVLLPKAPPAPPVDRSTSATPEEDAGLTKVGVARPRAVGPSWEALSEQGRHQEALSSAEQQGFTRLCEELDADRLVMLGDTARLAKNGPRATHALRAVRRRFPGSQHAAAAVFLLGRLEADRQDFEAAERWFSSYLVEAPAGPLLHEAWGRRLEALQVFDAARARAMAHEYLARFPDGPAGPVARKLTR